MKGDLARRLRHLSTGPWPRAAVIVVAVTLLCVQTPLAARSEGLRVGPALALSLVHTGSLVLALWRPRAAAALSVASSAALMVASVPAAAGPWPWDVTPLITQVLVIAVVCVVGGWPTGLATLIASTLVPLVVIGAAWRWRGVSGPVSDLLVFASIATTAYALTVAVQGRLFVAAALAREQRASAEELARRRLVEEKARIARELHDVIAHTMSLISVQARSAAYRLSDVPPAAAAEFEEIADRAREALTQMRGVLAVLRTDDDAAQRRPQPGLPDVRALVETVRAAGLEVAMAWEVPDDLAVAPVTGMSAHRIVQEALSNVMRHAPDLPATVRVRVATGVLVASVENPLPRPPVAAGGGHGLIGMRERAAAAGGVVECGPTPGGHYLVVARLPLRGRP